MGKVAQKSTKYLIKAELSAGGIVEKPDVVGAIFGQTEGLLSEEMDLRELQERGKIGRIDVQVSEEDGSSTAEIEIPSSLDAANTSILAASLETIERVGPTNAQIKVEEIEDQRVSKRDYIVKRAKQLLSDIKTEKSEKVDITDEIKEDVRAAQVEEYRGFEAGPKAGKENEIIFVEGRADLVNLLRHGVKNAVAIGGTSVPDKLADVSDDEDVVAFLDGDRGGDLILKELKEQMDVDYVVRAPEGKEVEELGRKKVFELLRDREPEKFAEDKEVEEELDEEIRDVFRDIIDDLIGTKAVYLLDEDMEIIKKRPIKSMKNDGIDECHAVVFDGQVDREIVEKVEGNSSYLVGMDKDGYATSSELEILTREDLN